MDEFDLMAQRSAAFDSLPEDRKRAISALQSAFLATPHAYEASSLMWIVGFCQVGLGFSRKL